MIWAIDCVWMFLLAFSTIWINILYTILLTTFFLLPRYCLFVLTPHAFMFQAFDWLLPFSCFDYIHHNEGSKGCRSPVITAFARCIEESWSAKDSVRTRGLSSFVASPPDLQRLKDVLKTSLASMDVLPSLSCWHLLQLLSNCLPLQIYAFWSH